MRCRDSTPRTGESNQEVVDGASGAEDKDGPLIDDRTILWQTEFRTPGSAGNRRSGRRRLLRPVLAQAAGAEPNAKRAEALQSLEQERDQMRAILEGAAARVTEEQEQTQIIRAALGQGLIGLDTRGCVQLVNPTAERLLGWAEEELLGNPLHDYLHPPQGREPHCDAQDCPLLPALCGERSHRAEQDTFCGKEGRSLPVAYICTPVIRAGACAGALLVFDDITERLAAAAALDAYARQVAEQNAQLQTYCAELTEAQEELEAQARALAEANVRLEALAATDGKTGLANYSTFQECLRNAWAAVTEEEGAAPFSL